MGPFMLVRPKWMADAWLLWPLGASLDIYKRVGISVSIEELQDSQQNQTIGTSSTFKKLTSHTFIDNGWQLVSSFS